LCVHNTTTTILKHILTNSTLQINSGKPVVIDFWATWCGPCRAISPIFERISGETPGVEFYKVDVDTQPDISQEVGIRAVSTCNADPGIRLNCAFAPVLLPQMPTFLFFKDGNKVDSLMGANPPGLEVSSSADLSRE
jgi:thioredoxin 1